MDTTRRALLLLPAAAWAATHIGPARAAGDAVAGSVQRLQGSAVALQDAVPRSLKIGDRVLIGDVLSTGPGGRLEIKMIDDGIFTLGERTVFVVLDYTFGGGGAATLRLMEGALSAVSGQIAKLGTNSFRLETEFATIGVRGTKLWAGTMHDGAFHVALWSEGGVIVENKSGRAEITTRGFGTHIKTPGAAPSTPEQWPEMMNDVARKSVGFN
ncbi:MAG: FecR domain-containing protein [Rhodospirillaceae bacterium]|nr:FecR domain-containing protein [Rhodospirillaceae bacterium]